MAWVVSLLGGAFFLWLASRRLALWPDALVLESIPLLVSAVVLHVPYAFVRAMRLRFALDPLVEAAAGPERPFDRRVLYGSGFVSFFFLLALPFKLGELSRPILIERGRAPGVGMPEAVSAVAMERLVDGVLICGMLFGGLALGHAAGVDADRVGDVRAIGRGMLALFGVGLCVLLVGARAPSAAARLTTRIFSPIGPRIATRLGKITERVSGGVRGILALRQAFPFLAWSICYWAITTLQLWLVMAACGIEVGAAEAAAIVAIVGLSIQLPGGPAQAGTFQLGAGLALGLYLDDAALAGPGSSFAAIMYVLQLAGAGAMALVGAVLMGRATSNTSAVDAKNGVRVPSSGR